MDNVKGAFFSYKDFRQSLHHRPLSPRVWTGTALTQLRQSLASSELDIVALAHDDSLQGCEVTPGMGMAMQWLKPGTTLNGHSHAWWHLFVIQAGAGTLVLGDAEPVSVSPGDVLLVPAWTTHGFVNTSSTEPLAMLAMSNMPQMSQLSSFADSQGLITGQR
ncbi:cupin domain-containing protein [Pseudomonas sp. N3-W]|uniref:Cupin domain-containing protein n=1 Tax=Pseudomonas fungipugnans TaxID=3024217 RepID=A0ABT6QLU0_9PSED|nr:MULTISPECIES: cupin domain-containing protein [unclassified Pseudomonas]MDI2591851.1 cupin domain-containing protein [Pseudomonas sp. 681]UWF48325.1 cupin domain-containing protein [Pseudomonas sp. N3-W]